MTELIKAHDIEIKTKILAKHIADEHRGDKTPIVMIGLLKGAFMFYSDLVRGMDIDVEIDFMRVKSYVAKNKQGDIQILKDLETPIKGKHVYIVDDILDSGNTMAALIEYLGIKWPKTLNIVTCLKRKETKFNIKNYPLVQGVQLHGFEIDDEWVVGYGMDNDKGHCRNYKSIFAL